jgi:hypothetical protein
MNLVEKIKTIYSELTHQDFKFNIIVQDDADGRGMYIAQWNHPTLQRPTDEQLAEIK